MPIPNPAVTWAVNTLKGNVDLSGGNLIATANTAFLGTVGTNVRAGPSSGKYYWEVLVGDVGDQASVGIATQGYPVNQHIGAAAASGTHDGYGYRDDGKKLVDGAAAADYPSTGGVTTYTNADVIGVAMDFDNGAVWFSKNNLWIDGNGTDTSSVVLGEIEAGTPLTSALATWGSVANNDTLLPWVGVDNNTNPANATLRILSGSWTGTAPDGFVELQMVGGALDIDATGKSNVGSQMRIIENQLVMQNPGGATQFLGSGFKATTGDKWYWEVTWNAGVAGECYVGVFDEGTAGAMKDAWTASDVHLQLEFYGYTTVSGGATYADGIIDTGTLGTPATNETWGFSWDEPANEFKVYDELGAVVDTISGITATDIRLAVCQHTGAGDKKTINFGATAFSNTVPDGFVGPDAPNTGRGESQLEVQVEATGHGPAHGTGESQLEIQVEATGHGSPHATAESQIELQVEATGHPDPHAAGESQLELQVEAAGHSVRLVSVNIATETDTVLALGTRGDGSVSLTMSLTATGSYLQQRLNGGLSLTMSMTATGTKHASWQANLTLPALVASGDYITGRVYIGAPTLPALTATGDANSGSDITLPALTVSGTMVAGTDTYAIITLLNIRIASTMTVPAVGTSALTLPAIRAEGTWIRGAVLDGIAVLRPIQAVGTMTVPEQMTAAITLPAITIAGSIIIDSVYTAGITLPAIKAVGVLANAITTTNEGWVLNTKLLLHTKYPAYPFNSFAQLSTSVYGGDATGLYRLAGADDNGTDIAATFLSGADDYQSARLKAENVVYVGYESDGVVELLVGVDDSDTFDHVYTVDRDLGTPTNLRPARVALGRGLKSRYWRHGIRNVAGAYFKVNELSHGVSKMKRKS